MTGSRKGWTAFLLPRSRDVLEFAAWQIRERTGRRADETTAPAGVLLEDAYFAAVVPFLQLTQHCAHYVVRRHPESHEQGFVAVSACQQTVPKHR